jgi:RNA polymerase sigma factor (sigma-70 family)
MKAGTVHLPEASPVSGDASLVDRQVLLVALTRLSVQQRAVIVLRYFEDLSEASIADVLGCSTGTVKKQVALSV